MRVRSYKYEIRVIFFFVKVRRNKKKCGHDRKADSFVFREALK